jgi:hypothetical protein
VNASSGTIANTAVETQTNPDPIGTQSSSVNVGPTSAAKPTRVPTAHTGEPWSGWPYWLLIFLMGMAGLSFIGVGRRRRDATKPAQARGTR